MIIIREPAPEHVEKGKEGIRKDNKECRGWSAWNSLCSQQERWNSDDWRTGGKEAPYSHHPAQHSGSHCVVTTREVGGSQVRGSLDLATGTVVHHTGTHGPGHIRMLVDTEAVFNLLGLGFVEAAARNMNQHMKKETIWRKLDTPKISQRRGQRWYQML